jgi:hypothetical protein
MTMTATILAGHQVQLTGTVTDDSPSTVKITFSGVLSGTCYPNAAGNYTFVTASATGLGMVDGQGLDAENQLTNPCQAQLTKPAPSLTLAISYGAQKTVTLSGQVTDLDAGGRTVTFTGEVNGSIVSASDGTFSYTATPAGLGKITASTVDLWGQASNTPSVTVSNNAPVISGFTASQTGTVWTFSGKVTDESPDYLRVSFTGPGAVNGQTATCCADGTFALTVQLPSGTCGMVTAQTTDWWGVASNIAGVYISS